MWETTALDVPLSKVGKNVKVRGLPHLAKNERDMGHPMILGRERPHDSWKGKTHDSWKGKTSTICGSGEDWARSVKIP
jgi:hypothetical protein